MNTRTITAAAATLALLAACSKAPEAETTAATDADHTEHAAETPAVAALPRTPAPAGARVFIVSPRDGETVTSPLRVVFGIEGMALAPAGEINPNAGHHHLLVDTDLANPGVPVPTDEKHLHFGKAQTEADVTLTPGTHTLQLVLGDYLHIPFDPVIASDKITVTVN